MDGGRKRLLFGLLCGRTILMFIFTVATCTAESGNFDSKALMVEFSKASYNSSESSGNITVTLLLRGGTSTNKITVTVTPSNLSPPSAKGNGTDYNSTAVNATFTAGTNSTTVNISVTKDNILEESEKFNLKLSTPSSSSDNVTLGKITTANATITDSTTIMVEFSKTSYNGSESSGNITVTLLLKGGTTAINITVTVTPSNLLPPSAKGNGTDYNSTAVNATFTAGTNSTTVNIPVTKDNILEESEKFYLSLSIPPSLSGKVTLGNITTANATITDSNTLMVEFSKASYNGSESSGNIPITVLLRGGTFVFNITVTVAPSNLSPPSAEGNGVDYNSTAVTATFTAGTYSTTVNIPVAMDDILEESEKFNLSLSISSSLSGKVTLGYITTANATITDSTTLKVEFSKASYNGSESSGNITVTLLLKGGTTAINITVTVTPSNLLPPSAKGNGTDYNSTAVTATFTAGANSTTVNIPVTKDHIYERSEKFNLSLSIPSSLSGKVTLGNIITANATITDSTDISIKFKKSSYTVDEENAKPVQLVLVLSSPSSTNITVTVQTNNITATGGDDYDIGPYNVTFPAGMTEASFNVTIKGDRNFEEHEIFQLNIIPSSLPDRVTISNPSIVNVTIMDNERATISFNQSMYSVNEDGGSVQPILVLSNPSSTDITVQVKSKSDTATDNDYNSGPYNATFTIGNNTATLNIPITKDTIHEGNESFTLTIMKNALPSRVSRGSPSMATVTIVDTTVATISFNQSTYSVNEDGGSVRPVLILSNPSSTDITVLVRSNSDTANGRGIDYTSGRYNITITAGKTAAILSISIVNDTVHEGNESFALLIMNNQLPNRVSRGSPSMATVTIVDTTVSTVRFNHSAYSVNESDGKVNITLYHSNPSSINITLRVNSSNVSTGDNNDYDAGPYTVTITAGRNDVTFSVTITDDNIREESETFNLIIDEASLTGGITSSDPNIVTVTIMDRDVVSVKFIASLYSVGEMSMAVFMLMLSNKSSTEIAFKVNNKDVTATGGVDYVSGPYGFKFPAGMTEASFTVTIMDDKILESNETFQLSINTSSLPNRVTVDNPNEVTMTIVDDDSITISFNQSTYSVNEDDRLVQPVLVLSNPSSTDITVLVKDRISAGKADDDDYNSGPYNVTITAGKINATLDIQIVNDTIHEGSESFILTIMKTSLPSRVSRGSPRMATVTIVDTTVSTVRFNHSTYSVNESDGKVNITLYHSNPSSIDIVLRVNSSNVSTGDNNDYDAGPYTVTITAGQNDVSFSVAINDDNIREESEAFNLIIDESSLPSGVSSSDPNAVIVTIMDNDTASVKFQPSSYHTNEKNKVRLMLVLSIPSSTDVIVNIQSKDTSATGSVDYVSGPYNVTFPAERTEASFTVTIMDDNILESNETFQLSINTSSLPNRVTVDNPNEITVTIVDNDSATISFNQSTYSVNEDDGPVQLVLVLSNPSSTDITVRVDDNNGKTLAGDDDYSSGPYNVTVIAGRINATLNIPINHDTIHEGSESFALTIINSSLPSRVSRGRHNVATITIVDTTVSTVRFNHSAYSVNESDQKVNITLYHSNPSSINITLRVNSSNVSTGDNNDYDAGPYTVTIPAGQNDVTFSVIITDDDIREESETFNLIIDESSLPSGVTSSDPNTVTVTIMDNDAVNFKFTASSFTVAASVKFLESSYRTNEKSNVQLMLALSNPSSTDVIVNIQSKDTSATGGVDYVSGPYTVTFPAGMTEASFTVTIINDKILESNERFKLSINIDSLPNRVTVDNPSEVTVTIVDNDPITISFDQSTYRVNEDDGSVQPVLVLSNPSSTDITVLVDSINKTATGLDYASRQYEVTFISNQTSVSINISIFEDVIKENDEKFILIINKTLPNRVSRDKDNRQATVIIKDTTGKVAIKFSQPNYNISEITRDLTVTLLLRKGISDNDITVTVMPSNQSAEGNGVDYTSTNITATFPAGANSTTINTSVTMDDIVEGTEMFYLEIIIPSSENDTILGDQSTAVVYIHDSTAATISFSHSTYSVYENDGSVQPVLVLSNPSSTDITVLVEDNSSTATGSMDYIFEPHLLRLIHEREVLINVSVINDDILEGNETFILTISQDSLSNNRDINVTVGRYAQATVTIVDTTRVAIVTKHPTSVIKFENETASLSCEATASGTIRYQWRRVNGEISSDRAEGVNTSTLTISPVQQEDEDEYYCVATYGIINGLKHNNTSNRGSIIVYGPPVLHSVSPIYYVIASNSFTLNCTATNDPQSPNELRFRWMKDFTEIDSESSQWNISEIAQRNNHTNASQIIINNLTLEQHNGTYICRVDNFMPDKSVDQTAVVVVEIPATITTHPPETFVFNDESVTLSCEATGSGPIRYQWRRMNGEISSDRAQGVNTPNLTISPVQQEDEDEYYCVASNGGMDGLLYSNASQRANIVVYGPPVLHSVSPVYYVIAGNSFTLNCTATNDPQSPNELRFRWMKDLTEIDSESSQWTISEITQRSNHTNASQIIINNLTVEQHNGTYICRVDNFMPDKSVNQTTVVVVEIPATITTHPQETFVFNDESVTLSCEATGSDPIRYQWRRMNGEISNDRAEGVNTPNLTISSVQREDEDEYYCVASNGGMDGSLYSNTSQRANIIVYGPPVLRSVSPVYYVIAGNSFTLNCTATNDPQSPNELRFRWFKGSTKIDKRLSQWNITDISLRNPLTITSQIFITNLTLEQHNGSYSCKVDNYRPKKAVDQFTNIVVETPVVVIAHPPEEIIVFNSLNVTLSCKATGSGPIRYQWSRVNGEISSDRAEGVNTPTLIISSVTEQDEDTYYCMASNGGMDGSLYKNSSQRANIIVYGPPSIEEELDPTYYVVAGDAFTLSCTVTDDPQSPNGTQFLWYKDGSDIIQSTETIANKPMYTSKLRIQLLDSDEHSGQYRCVAYNHPSRNVSSSTTLVVEISNFTNSTVVMSTSQSVDQLHYSSTVMLPSLDKFNKPISHLFVIVTTNGSLLPSQVPDDKLDNYDSGRLLNMYITTVVRNMSGDQWEKVLVIGNRNNFTHDQVKYYNAPLNKDNTYYLFVRAYAYDHTESNPRYASSGLSEPITAPVASSDDGDSGIGGIAPIIGVIIVLIIIIILIIIVIIVLMRFRKKNKKLNEPLSPSAKDDIPLHEKKMEKAMPVMNLKSFPVINLKEQEVKTSVGQPTTLYIEAKGNPMPEITWMKDGDPINYTLLQDGSLYIPSTTMSDEGSYTVTASSSEGKSGETIELVVLNPQFVPSNANKKPIKIDRFAEHLAMLHANINKQFSADYDSLVAQSEYSYHAARLAINVNKNRYKNILAYDHSRVVLNLQDNCSGSDYINASFIDGYNEKKAYIACQGPMASTVADFWRMVWEQNVNTIVMVTNLTEEGKPKCQQYWPNKVNGSSTYGNVSVTLLQEEVLAEYTIRSLALKMIEASSEAKSVSLEIKHFHFTVWPDHGVPKYATAILAFHKRVCKHHQRKRGSPLLVHCSAGVGRTGTFIAIDIELQRIKQEGVVDVYNTVYRLRSRRSFTVQTLAQYVFVFDALMESIMCGDNTIGAPTNVAKERLEELAKVNPTTKRSGYESQFQKLQEASPKEDDFQYVTANLPENRHKNRSMKHLPPDSSRVYLTGGYDTDYICANYIDGYRHRKAYLATEGPMESTLVEFWAMIWERKSHAIVMLSHLEENGREVCAKYWPNKVGGEAMKIGQYVIELTSESDWGKYFVRRIMKLKMITGIKESPPRTITQFQYKAWPDHSCPSEASSIMDMVEVLEQVQRKTGNGPITVHCSDGMGRTGTFCALMMCHDRLKTEHMADVFYAIKTIRAQRPGMVENAEQYKFIHKTLIEIMDRLATYSTFN